MPEPFDELTEQLVGELPESLLQTVPANDIAGSEDLEFAFRWAWKNIGRDPAGLKDDMIPHPSCRAALQFHRDDSKAFFGWIAKFEDRRDKIEQSKRTFQDDQRKHFKLIHKVRDYYRDVASRQTAESANLPPDNA